MADCPENIEERPRERKINKHNDFICKFEMSNVKLIMSWCKLTYLVHEFVLE